MVAALLVAVIPGMNDDVPPLVAFCANGIMAVQILALAMEMLVRTMASDIRSCVAWVQSRAYRSLPMLCPACRGLMGSRVQSCMHFFSGAINTCAEV